MFSKRNQRKAEEDLAEARLAMESIREQLAEESKAKRRVSEYLEIIEPKYTREDSANIEYEEAGPGPSRMSNKPRNEVKWADLPVPRQIPKSEREIELERKLSDMQAKLAETHNQLVQSQIVRNNLARKAERLEGELNFRKLQFGMLRDNEKVGGRSSDPQNDPRGSPSSSRKPSPTRQREGSRSPFR